MSGYVDHWHEPEAYDGRPIPLEELSEEATAEYDDLMKRHMPDSPWVVLWFLMAMNVSCAWCHAPRGVLCRTPGGSPTFTHKHRKIEGEKYRYETTRSFLRRPTTHITKISNGTFETHDDPRVRTVLSWSYN